MSEADGLKDQPVIASAEADGESPAAAVAKGEVRPAVEGLLTSDGKLAPADPEAVAEDPLARFKAQYDRLPAGNILAKDSTWEIVQARLCSAENAEKLRKVQEELQGGGWLYAVRGDGSVEFIDDNADTPPMLLKDKEQYAKDGTLQLIFKRDPQQMDAARGKIDQGKAEWASVQEMLDWAKANGFEVFEASRGDRNDYYPGLLMELAAAASPTGHFVGKPGDSLIETALKDARFACFSPLTGVVFVTAWHPEERSGNLGLLRRLNV